MRSLACAVLFCFALLPTGAYADGKFMKLAAAKKDLYATFTTTQGEVVVKLFSKDAPVTVANFVGLAEGEKEFTDPASGKPTKKRFYDGLLFHRVIPNFMIQGGDPVGSGSGGPGYTFQDEFQSGRTFDKVGLLAMANRGPSTNGSQFFVTTAVTSHLNGRHTIFGEVISGYDVIVAIGNAPTGPKNRPITDIRMTKVAISDKPPAAKGAPAEKKEAKQ